jgi:hypothetical protein
MDGGRVTGGVSATGIQDNAHTRKWGSRQLEGAHVIFHGGTASPATMTVADNDGDSLTFEETFDTNPSVGDSYTIQRYGVWSYVTDTTLQNTAHRGIARQNTYYEPPGTIWPGRLTPGGWGPDTYLDNDDDYATYRSYDVGAGGGHDHNWWYLMRMLRRTAQVAELPYEDEGDGFAINSPQAFRGIYFSYDVRNQGRVGKVVFAVREPGSEEWRDVVTDDDEHASLTPVAAQYVDLTDYAFPGRLGFFVLPRDGVEIPTTRTQEGTVTAKTASTVTDSSLSMATDEFKSGVIEFENASTAKPQAIGISGNSAAQFTINGSFSTQPTVGDAFEVRLDTRISHKVEFRSGDSLELYLHLDHHPALVDAVYRVGDEVEIVDMQTTLRLGGGTDAELPHELITLGGRGHWVGLPLGHRLRIAMDPTAATPLVSILDNAGDLVARAQWAAVVERVVADADGNPFRRVPRQLFPLRPLVPMLVNPSFDADLAGWSAGTVTGGVTVDVAWDGDVHHGETPGAMAFDVSAAPGGAWVALQQQAVAGIPIDTMVECGFWARTSDVDLTAYLRLTVAANLVITVREYVYQLPAADAWYPIGAGLRMPVGDGQGDTGTATIDIGIAANGAHTGQLYLDDGAIGPNLYVTEPSIGTQAVTVSWREGWHA